MCSAAGVGALPSMDLRWDFHKLLAWTWGQTAGESSWAKPENIQWKGVSPISSTSKDFWKILPGNVQPFAGSKKSSDLLEINTALNRL